MPGTETSNVHQYPLLKTIKQDVNEMPNNKHIAEKMPLLSFTDIHNIYQGGQMSGDIHDPNHLVHGKQDTGSAECSQQTNMQQGLYHESNAVSTINLAKVKEQD